MKFILEINLGNDAMQDYRDIALALAKVSGNLDTGAVVTTADTERIRDLNGNTVGSWRVEDDKSVRRSGAERVR